MINFNPQLENNGGNDQNLDMCLYNKDAQSQNMSKYLSLLTASHTRACDISEVWKPDTAIIVLSRYRVITLSRYRLVN